jgi:hypothetical protein
MLGAERARQFDLHGLRRAEGGVQPLMLAGERLLALVDLIREENGLGFAVRSESHRLCGRALAPESREDPRKSLPHLRQRVHANGHWTELAMTIVY